MKNTSEGSAGTISRAQFLGGSCAAALAGIVARGASPEAFAAEDGGETGHAWETKPDPIDPADIGEVVDCDVLVIGAGTAGVVATHSAAEAGAKVVLLEKAPELSARGHDVAAVGTKLQQQLGAAIDLGELRECWSQITCNKTDMSLFNTWATRSGEVMDYYIDRVTAEGVPVNMGSLGEEAAKSTNPCTREFPTAIQFGKSQVTADGEYAHHLFVRTIEGFARDCGADIRYNTKALQLLRDGDGPVTGAIAQNLEDGSYVQVNAKNGVILATGGITQNEDMLRMWAPPVAKTDQILYSPAGGNDGDGLCMGMWVGAAHQKTNQATMALPSSAALGGQNSTDGRGICWMTVNLKGRRYFDETSPGPNMCHATLPQPQSMGYSIFDGNWEDNILKMMPDGKDFRGIDLTGEERDAAIEKDVKQGLMFRADTLEELAEQVGMPTDDFVEQVKRYNGYCQNGQDEEFAVPADKLFPIDTPPFYASRIRCGVLVCIYGLNVDSKSRVCDEDDMPIGGLYAIGNCQGNFFTDSYPILVPGISHGRCVTFGRLVGQALTKGEDI
jgi:fumarate reductase flavoprotein subunit